MSRWVTLTPRGALPSGLELDTLDPAACAERSEREIAALGVWCGAHTVPIGDLFGVSGERSIQLRLEGALDGVDAVGAGMTGGVMIVTQNVGRRAGAGMQGGHLEIKGSVGDDAGSGMKGGLLVVAGTAGARLGAATPGAARGMTGGEILVHGNAGREVGARMRRGLVVVAGDAGDETGRDMIAGTVVVGGQMGMFPGTRNKRGSIIVCGGVTIPSTYRYACTYEPPFLRVLFVHLERRRGFGVPHGWMSGRYRRYCGDAAGPGRGEILELQR